MSRAVLRQLQNRRGFTLIEVMLVCALIGILSTLAIPVFQRFAARAQKAEMHNVLGKMELALRNNYEATGVYGNFSKAAGSALNFDPGTAPGGWNPPVAANGQSASWDPNLAGYETFPFPPDGPLKLRYHYSVSADGQTLTLEAQGTFIGIPTWTYRETFSNGNPPELPPVEDPPL